MLQDQEPTRQHEKADGGLTGRQMYNIVSDTVTGVNIRSKDNLLQALAIVGCVLLGAAIGAVVVSARLAGALIGGFIGMLAGWVGSGVFLMVYRGVMHIRGRHD